MRIPRRLPIYPWNDNEPIYFGTGSDVAMYWDGTYFCMDGLNAELRISFATAGITNLYGGIASGDDLCIYCNAVDAQSYLKLFGNGSLWLAVASGGVISLYNGTTAFLDLRYVSPDVMVDSKYDGKNLFLRTTGTGLIKFGTYTAGAELASIGYIDILDAAGNARKLMVQA